MLDLQAWVPGQGSTGIFTKNGLDSGNFREWGEGPNGKGVILWKAQPDGTTDANGGWTTSQIPINHVSMYRLAVWIKKTNSLSGTTFLGCANVTSLAGVVNSNPYFVYGQLPKIDRWYLLVGYIHGSSDPSTMSYGGIYDGVTGQKVISLVDFKFIAGTPTTNHRAFLFYDRNVEDRQYFYAPRLDVVNGNEPSIADLLETQDNTSNQGYFAGKVGIKTTNPGDYDLAVNGKIRAKEIKVENANWPDYVFHKDYTLLNLKETELFIKMKGHLPGIPSAEEIKTSGVDLGSMNAKLLEKIEELTLHLIQKEKDIETQNARIKKLEEICLKSR